MRYLLSQVPIPLGYQSDEFPFIIASFLRVRPEEIRQTKLERRSLDARHKGSVRFLASLSFDVDALGENIDLPSGVKLEPSPATPSYIVPRVSKKLRVVIVGSGPAGTFCALRCLDYGLEPIILERGPSMSARVAGVNRLWKEGEFSSNANAQFGEGGAGTFSDGKLTTRIGHPATRYVIETFIQFGAHPRIAYLAKPHVGTDVIRKCSVLIRKDAERRGARYLWNSKLIDLELQGTDVVAAVLESGERIPCDALVVAVGHSARDTFEMLHAQGVAMKPKPFAMGLRIEHPQELIDKAQYGSNRGHPHLPPADYKLVCNLGLNRATYSFCMCPGGEVTQCTSEEGACVVNGMSNENRNSGFANSGLVAKVNPSDFGSNHILGGMYFQRFWEQQAFRSANETYGAPATLVQDFLAHRASGKLHTSSFQPFLVPSDVTRCLPPFIVDQLRQTLPVFNNKIHGYTSSLSVLVAIESRTSSPIQMLRGDDGQSSSHSNLYPCGEGAGFAGGITSAAVDGIRVAEWIAQRAGASVFTPFEKQIKATELANEY